MVDNFFQKLRIRQIYLTVLTTGCVKKCEFIKKTELKNNRHFYTILGFCLLKRNI